MSAPKRNQKSALKAKKNFSPVFKIGALIIIAAFIIYFVFQNLFIQNERDKEYMFKKGGELTFYNEKGQTKAKIDIQIADTEFDRQLGLMFRKNMEENQGMLFIFPVAEVQSFWMRNTLISLDMIFINEDKKIITIHKNTVKLSDNSYTSTGPAKYVLEVNAGYTNKFNIKEGDHVNWERSKE